ncbi:hypothetical protein K505DRAFT_321035 [Melanomma pulvis-pyrius CBS 109.77]|uniref:Glycine zipper domain-containing protein n=1 Tax=Melanomma pulvis-pyrius CBS 109.77 TaxID=1314802 RepID=A0A6A6XST2_9PLEO|nr:hypothetical protein K505DRAFT_321035 [Melanomma pulvis-pyrius CBS 109.77]
MPSNEEKEIAKAQELPDEERLKQAAVSAQKALDAQSTAQSLKEAASSITDPKKREKILRDAYQKETEAHGNSKKARILQSGAFQGATGGAGIGGAVGMGVGTVVGTVVGAVTAIPTTGLGALAGAGVGAIHGPFIKLPKFGGKDDGKKDGKGEKSDKGMKEVKEGDKIEEGEEVVPDPTALRQAADAVAEERAKQSQQGGGPEKGMEKKKPRKIEIRSGKVAEKSG